ncbi:unnamed protein product [Prorocentrum cordatum]|uniref:Altered inheritance of mitochondria protein 24, mitochondrial n=1 Tax=Prorocentrum cordatum TaxID=2364126 RepID=A0ABN9RWN6_9DINO|nr:unnamed protein product [Polarella glacialis]
MFSLRALALLTVAPAAAGEGVHNLTICNGYAENRPLSVYTVNSRAKLTEEPMRYKQCKAIAMELQEGERLDFKMGGLSVGVFHATHLPFVASTLVLVPFKKGNHSMAATFASHTFGPASGDRAQVAVIDAYAGDQQGAMRIRVAGRQGQRLGAAELRPGSAVALDENTYEVSLTSEAEQSTRSVPLRAAGGSSHVVLRVGSEEFSQELLVKPVGWAGPDDLQAAEDEQRRESGALRAGLGGVAAAAAAAVLSA